MSLPLSVAKWLSQSGWHLLRSWQPVRLAVPQLAGKAQARVRFRLTSDTSQTHDGWYVDDIELTVASGSAWLFVDGAETGSTTRWSAAVP